MEWLMEFIHFFYSIKLPLFRDILESFQGGGEAIENFIASRLQNQNVLVDHIGMLVRWSCYAETPIY